MYAAEPTNRTHAGEPEAAHGSSSRAARRGDDFVTSRTLAYGLGSASVTVEGRR